MAYHYTDYVYTKSFTPKEPEVELFETACKENIIISLINNQGKSFISCKVIENVLNDNSDGKVVLYIVDSAGSGARHSSSIGRLTCCLVSEVFSPLSNRLNIDKRQVIVTTTDTAVSLIQSGMLNMENICLILLQECQKVLRNKHLQQLMNLCHSSSVKPRVLGLAGSILSAVENLSNVETEVQLTELALECKMETASDVVAALKYGIRPIELLVEHEDYFVSEGSEDIVKEISNVVNDAIDFLEDHCYDPTDIYSDFEDDFVDCGDPKAEPLYVFNTFMSVVNNLGLWAANKAALLLLRHLEKKKMNTKFERHFLLLCLATSVLVRIRAILDNFLSLVNEKECIYKYSSPKILRLFEIIRQFRDTTAIIKQKKLKDDSCSESDCKCHLVTQYLLKRLEDSSITLKEMYETEKKNTDGHINGLSFRRGKGEWKTRGAGRAPEDDKRQRPYEVHPHSLCGLILTDSSFNVKLLFYMFADLKSNDADFEFVRVHFTGAPEGDCEAKGFERAYRQRELVLRSFRMRECNLLIGSTFLESGIDLPKCNLVIRFTSPLDYRSYVQGKARARGPDSVHCLLVSAKESQNVCQKIGQYYCVEKMLLRKSKNFESDPEFELMADSYQQIIVPFCPLQRRTVPHVDFSSAIALVNRYCAKLPSDTFTRLTSVWTLKEVPFDDGSLYICTLQLPINSPLKKQIIGPAMPTPALARRFAAFQCCLTLNSIKELDDDLLPITKESFWIREEEELANEVEEPDDIFLNFSVDVRPGTTKRRQYYNKRIANCFADCRPGIGVECYLYDISMILTCPLPDEQNTRGRTIRAPEDSPRGFGILTSKPIPPVGAFPIFTRSGEVQVELVLAPERVILTHDQIEKILPFINYTFTSVLRLQKYLMMFDPNTSENSYFIVPTTRSNISALNVDWDFLHLIFKVQNDVLEYVTDEVRAASVFDRSRFLDAVVCPWYRNQDQPQYFYVAEICENLTPQSQFPGNAYTSFECYYYNKYAIKVQDVTQALLDVDHTSARLNFLTPRYVNRKGVALPTTSEEKKKARRENLEQKQILVPELCKVHPFPASLWQKAVCLPCILHRINALLLADEVRRLVAHDLNIGNCTDNNIEWCPLDFGWKLADVLKTSKMAAPDSQPELVKLSSDPVENGHCLQDSAAQDTVSWMEVGTWSNDLANTYDDPELVGDVFQLPANITLLTGEQNGGLHWKNQELQCVSPTNWIREASSEEDLFSTSERSFSDSGRDSDDSDESEDSDSVQGLRIEFKDKDVAEAVEPNRREPSLESLVDEKDVWECDKDITDERFELNKTKYEATLLEHITSIKSNNLILADVPFKLPWSYRNTPPPTNEQQFENDDQVYGTANNYVPQFTDEHCTHLPHSQFIRSSIRKYQVLLDIKKLRMPDPVPERQLPVETKFSIDPEIESSFSFDAQPDLVGHPGPSPNLILQALTMSNANDGINLERLETIGDSFLKYAITTYLYCTYENVHEGKLSHLRSKQVSNLNLYRLGKKKKLGESMVATKFEPHDNWLPPCYFVPRELERALIETGVPASHWNRADLPALHKLSSDEVIRLVRERGEQLGIIGWEGQDLPKPSFDATSIPCFVPYNLMTQHSIPDKSIADCVEALIGAYLVACGPRGTLLFMSWLGIKVLPKKEVYAETLNELNSTSPGHAAPVKTGESGSRTWLQTQYGELAAPKPPLLRNVPDPEGELSRLLTGFEEMEENLHYHFQDRSYLLQAVTHASYYVNRLTDCYQRLEFLGDAVLDYLITRHLYEDPRHHSPGALTDLRSALVNNTIFASLAVRHDFHKFFRHLCPGLHDVLDRFVRIQQENNHAISDQCYLIEEEENEEAEDVEVPKALGDVFESVAGAIYLDSGMKLDAVWRVYYRMMKTEIDAFSTNVPKSPIRELLELEPETAQFGKPEKLADGRRVRVSVEVFGKGTFKGIGRNYRIAKCTAAKCALQQLKKRGLLSRKK